MIEGIKQLLSAMTAFGLLIVLGFFIVSLASVIFKKDLWESPPLRELTALLKRHGLVFGLIVALMTVLGSLFYSEIVGWEPCRFCWYQRIAIYPAAVLLTVAVIRKDRAVGIYLKPLLFIGGFIAFYHYLTQQFPFLDSGSCGALGGPLCSGVYTRTYGFITIPLMALTSTFLMWIFVSFAAEWKHRWFIFRK